MTIRRISSRRVVLTATFLAIASGGTAVCDDDVSAGGLYFL